MTPEPLISKRKKTTNRISSKCQTVCMQNSVQDEKKRMHKLNRMHKCSHMFTCQHTMQSEDERSEVILSKNQSTYTK